MTSIYSKFVDILDNHINYLDNMIINFRSSNTIFKSLIMLKLIYKLYFQSDFLFLRCPLNFVCNYIYCYINAHLCYFLFLDIIIIVSLMDLYKALELSSFQDFALANSEETHIGGSSLSSSSLLKVFNKKKVVTEKKTHGSHELFFSQIHHKYCVVCSERKVHLFFYDIDGDQNVLFKSCQEIDYQEPISFVCNNKNEIGFGNLKTFVIVGTDNRMDLYLLDEKTKHLVKKSEHGIADVQVLNFFNENSLFVVTKKHRIVKFDCGKYKFRHVDKDELQLKDLHKEIQDGIIKKSFLFGEITEESQDRFYYVFVTEKVVTEKVREEEQGKTQNRTYLQSVFIKQFWKKNEKIEEGSLYRIKKIESENPIFANLRVTKFKDSFFLQIEQEVYIVKKKYNSYYFYDNIRKKHENIVMRMQDDGTLCSVSDTVIELSKIIIGEPKCTIKIIDAIYYNVVASLISNASNDIKKEEYVFTGFQIYRNGKTSNYAIFFQHMENKYKLRFAYIKKIKSQTKLVDLIEKRKIKIDVVQQIARNLQISKRQFYLKLYEISKQEYVDIEKKLLESEDVSEIKKAVKYFLKRRKIPIYDTLKIFNKLYEIIKMHLKTRLEEKLVRQCLKCNLLMRKLKIQPDMFKKIGYDQFVQIKNKGLIDYLCQAIDSQIKFTKVNKQKKIDPKSAPKNQSVIRDVMSEFKIILLQDYEMVLQKIIEKFPNNLQFIFNRFFFLLPIFPYTFEFKSALKGIENKESLPGEKESDATQLEFTQPLKTFLPVRESQWILELSVETLTKLLSEYHLTSSVQNLLENIKNSPWAGKTRLIKHGFITSTRATYITKCNNLSGVNIFLKVCQIGNLCNDKKPDYQKVPRQLVQAFKRNNIFEKRQLINPELLKKYEQCSFYALLHYFLLKHDLQIGPKLSINKLIELPDDELIALFFLGKRQKSGLILNEFKQLYDKEKVQFDSVIEKFVNSENCSPVEINLLTACVQDKGREFQERNQGLIKIIIEGFCSKLQVRQKSRIDQLIALFQPIFLCKELNEKILTIMRIAQLTSIFTHFKLEKKTIKEIEMNGEEILELLLQNYFINNILSKEIQIDSINVTLYSPRNMLNVLIYLQEKLYPESISNDRIVKMYSKFLIDYEMFDILNDIIYQEDIVQSLGIQLKEFVKDLVKDSLEYIYQFESDKPFDMMKEHITAILELERDHSSPEYIRQKYKIKLMEIIAEIDPTISAYNIMSKASVEDYIIYFIENAYKQLTVNKIMEFYGCSKFTLDWKDLIEDLKFQYYIKLFGMKLLEKDMIEESLEVAIFFIETGLNNQLAFYDLITEIYLQSIKRIYDINVEDSNKDAARRYIELYAMNVQDQEILLKLFKEHQSQQNLSNFLLQKQEVEVYKELLFQEYKGSINITFDAIKKEISKLPKCKGNNYYKYYYFALMTLRNPYIAFRLTDIFNQYLTLYIIIDALSENIRQYQLKNDNQFPNFKQYRLKQLFFLGLWKEGQVKTNGIEDKIDLDTPLEENKQYINLITQLQHRNQMDLVNCMGKCSRYLNQKRPIYNRKIQEIQKREKNLENFPPQELPNKDHILNNNQESGQKQNVKILYKTLKEYLILYEECINQSMNNPLMNEKDVMSKIWEADSSKLNRTKEFKPIFDEERNYRRLDSNNSNNRILSEHEKDQSKYFQMFDTYSFDIEALLKSDKMEELLQWLKKYYYSDKMMTDVIALMQYFKIGEERKLKIAKTASRIQTNLDLKEIFTFEFYLDKPLEIGLSRQGTQQTQYEEEEEEKNDDNNYYKGIFQELTPKIKKFVNKDTVLYLSKIMKMSLKYDQVYEYKVYLLALEKVLQSLTTEDYDFRNIEREVTEYLTKLTMSPKFVLKNLRKILDKCYQTEVKISVIAKIKEVLDNNDIKCANTAEEENLENLKKTLELEAKAFITE